MTVRTRFAPSPTGKLHLGSAHTALYCWLYARRHGGQFVLRIEDTDRERSTEENVEAIFDGLNWLELDWDEGPFFQSKRTDSYLTAIQQLLDSGDAYRCTCTADELDAKRQQAIADKRTYLYDRTCREANHGPDCGPHVVRFKMPTDGDTRFDDMIKGPARFPNNGLDDWIIARTDGSPTYNFTVVIDDSEMEISHVLRGDDHFTNTFKQVNVYSALGKPLPKFAHMPLMHGKGGGKLSKRHGATSVIDYKDMGFLPIAVRNYLARLGWAHGDQEIFSNEELIQHFDIADIGASASTFDPEKFEWVNSQHMKQIPIETLAEMTIPFYETLGLKAEPGPWLNKVAELYVERGRTLVEVAEKSAQFFQEDVELDPKAAKKFLRPVVLEPLLAVRDGLAALNEFEKEPVEKVFSDTCEKFEIKLGKVAQPVRVAVTGTSVSPGIHETLALLGKNRTLDRLDAAIEFIRKRAESVEE
jgi:glutamyl-tRNA synthetase